MLLINIFGIKLSTLTIASSLATYSHPTSADNVVFNDLFAMPPVKMNWMPYMQALRADGISKSEFREL